MDKNFKINDGQEHRVVINCPLCGDKELHLVQDDLNSMQCLSCGYSTNDTYTGDPKKCEPFLNLDEDLRKDLRRETKKILNNNNITCILVTHDIEDANSMADRIIKLKEGKIDN